MTSPVESVREKLTTTVTAFVKDKRVPGLAAGVVHRGELVWSTGVGYADRAEARPTDPSTLFRIASITKTFTGTAIMQLRDEGRLSLDDPVVVHLPELRDASSPHGPIETVTLRRMLSHESGLMSEPPGTNISDAVYEGSPTANLARAREITTSVPPSTQQKYSNLAYQLLGEVVARASGRSYVDHLRSRIWAPLGISSTSFAPLEPGLADRRATGYLGRWMSDELEASPPPIPFWAEGGLWSCVEDLGRWLAFQTHEEDDAAAEAVLRAESLAEMHRARYLGDDAWTQAFGISWYTVRKGETMWVQHSGGDLGFISNACFDPKTKVGAIVLLNGVGLASALAMEIAEIARTAVAEAAPVIELPKPMPASFGPVLGIYHAPEFGELLRLEWRDGRLTLLDPTDPTWVRLLTPTDDPDAFLVDRGHRESGELVVFTRREDGRVRSALLDGGVLRRLDPLD